MVLDMGIISYMVALDSYINISINSTYMQDNSKFPKEFIIANNVIKVIIEDIDNVNNNYGTFSDATNEIHIYRSLRIGGKIIPLTKEQLKNTFWHEVMHCFQFYSGKEYDEKEAQVYANFLRDLILSSKYE